MNLASPNTISFKGREYDPPQKFAILMAWDAFRVALGAKPHHFTLREIVAWLTVRCPKN